jgi:hypothetical protein
VVRSRHRPQRCGQHHRKQQEKGQCNASA